VSDLKHKLEDVILPELEGLGMDLVEFELATLKGRNVLRLYIDKQGDTSLKCQVTIADCEKVSKAIQRLLDVEDVFYGANYTLEVSTPGIERPLKKVQDFTRFKEQLCRVTLKDQINGEAFFEGRIKNILNNSIIFDVLGKEKSVDFGNIKKAKLKYEGKQQ